MTLRAGGNPSQPARLFVAHGPVLESPPMENARTRRSLTAWMLYACVLFSLFSCGVHHGQLSGLQLIGLGGQFRALDSFAGHAGSPVDDGLSDSLPGGWVNLLQCPLCGSLALGIAFLLGLAWLRLGRRAHPRLGRTCPRLPPRHCWPPANPRASPLA